MIPKIGENVKVFDPRLFIDDIKTPLSLTMQPATVLKIYRSEDGYGDMVMDVRFHYDNQESKGHFVFNGRLSPEKIIS